MINWRYLGDRNAPKRVRSRPNEEERETADLRKQRKRLVRSWLDLP